MDRLNMIIKTAFFLAVLVLYLPSGMRANEWNEKTIVTFNEPV